MSKINPIQAAALKAPVSKPTAAKTTNTAAKVLATKSTTVKSSAVKAASPNLAVKPVAKVAVTNTDIKKSEKIKAAKEKSPKLKMERDSFTMPKTEYAQFSVLKERLAKLGQPAKKSELLRAGIMQLSAMTDTALKAAMSKVPAIKTGRPKKK